MNGPALLQSQLGNSDEPLPHVVGADGHYVTFAPGRDLLDLNSGYWNVPLGYGHARLIQRASEAYGILSYAHLYRRWHEPAVQLAEMLAQLAPRGVCSKLLFSNDGTGAAETALRLVIRWLDRHGSKADTILVMTRGYHGDSLVVRELGDYPTGERRSELPGLRVVQVTPAIVGESNLRRARRELHRHFRDSRVAAVFCEIVQGVGGMRVIEGDFLREIQKFCQDTDALLVVDEIATGIYRTGRLFAFEHYDLCPDMTLVGKGLTNGFFPVGLVMVGDRVASVLDGEFQHGHTTSGHPVGCEIARVVLKEMASRRLGDRVHKLGILAIQKLRAELDPRVTVRGLGLFIGIDVHATRRASALRAKLETQGVLVGQESSVLTVVPPFTIAWRKLSSALDTIISVVNRGQFEDD